MFWPRLPKNSTRRSQRAQARELARLAPAALLVIVALALFWWLTS